MRLVLAAFLISTAAPALAQGIVVPADLEIFDGPSGSTHRERGRLIVDDFYAIDSGFQLQTGGGKILCLALLWQNKGLLSMFG